uniref:Zinc finger, CCHC-type n=1 Tax=Tanacetum cinerariifolium TaxID=118510 RepID=A0A699HAP0_TANCI|nr:zinc finger, CCHC-type [Tanacetum cinerariifolium]
MHFLLTTLNVVYVLTTPMPELLEDATVEAIMIRAKWENDDYICRGHILNENSSSKKFICGKTDHFKRDCHSGKKNKEMLVVRERGLRTNPKTKVDAIVWWTDSGATTHFVKIVVGLRHTNRAVVRLPDPKRKSLGEKGIDCIFVGYAEHSKTYRFYVIEPNDSVSINSIIESRDAIFDENCFSSIHRPNNIIPKSVESQMDDHSMMYQLRDREIKLDYNTLTAIVLKKILKAIMKLWNLMMLLYEKKQLLMILMKVDGTIDKFKARLVIQGFRQKEGINYFDTYAPVARITTIRLLLALAAIHNLVIHQMDVKTTFLSGNLDEKVYIKQPEGFLCQIMSIRLSRFTSNPSRQHWQAITRVFKYLKGTMNYGLPYVGHPSVLEGYSDASWKIMLKIHLLLVDRCSCLMEVSFHRLLRSKHASLVSFLMLLAAKEFKVFVSKLFRLSSVFEIDMLANEQKQLCFVDPKYFMSESLDF